MKKSKKSTIMIVDDQEINRAILADLFMDTYEVIEASNGQEALDFLHALKKKVSLIILDIVMPVMDGFTFLEIINKEKINDIPVVMITAENSDSTAVKGYELGVFDFITKPFNPEIVLRRIKIARELYDHRRNLEKLLAQETQVIVQQTKKLERTNNFVIDALSTIVEFRHSESGNHVRRLRNIVKLILTQLAKVHPEYQLTNDKIKLIAEASAMHDLGKISIPDSILLKPGKLTDEEFDIMKKHTIYGCEILESLNYDRKDEFFATCYDIVRHHHERYDGRGYPDHLAGDDISLAAQVVAFADVYDALTTPRVYKGAYTHQQAMALINEGKCGAFNPVILKVFNSLEKKLSKVTDALDIKESAIIKEETPIANNKHKEPLTKRTLHLIEMERRKQQMISNLSGEVIFDYSFETNMITFSEKANEIFGLAPTIADFTNKLGNPNQIIQPDEVKKLLTIIRNVTPQHPNARLELKLWDKNGFYRWYEIRLCAIYDEEIRINIIGKLADIDDMKKNYENLREMADIDVLTKLYNRRAFIEIVATKLYRQECRGFFVLLDLDNFKDINDTYGHLIGDNVLSQIAHDLKCKVRSNDILGRLGGDEFAVFFTGVERDVLNKILERLCYCECNINGETHRLTKSIGVACCPEDATEYEDLMHKADIAMYNAKGNKKANYAFFDDTEK